MIIDIAAHILPPKYLEERTKRSGKAFKTQYAKYPTANPGLTDLEIRFRIMDKYEDLVQVLTIAGPNVESITEPEDTAELARIANDELAELIAEYPDRFVGAVACLPMNNVDAALKEADRAINTLRFRGVEIFTDINGKPVDSPEFKPLYGMIPFFSKRVQLSWDFNEMRMGYRDNRQATKAPLDYYRMFYCDTAIQGNTPALMCAYDFFGVDHMLFGTDTPYDNQLGDRVCRETIAAVRKMAIPDAEKKKIFEDNPRKLLRLPM